MENVLNLFTKVKPSLTKLEKLSFLLESHKTSDSVNGHMYVNDDKSEIRFVSITPELAKIIMENYNENNRPVSTVNVNTLYKEMISGKWLLNGETMTFNQFGDLTNGQHRLLALIKANLELPFIVITGLAKETFATIDGGRKRNTSDVLAYAGVPSYKTSAAITKFIWGFKQNKYTSFDNNSNQSLSKTEILEYYNSLNDAHESIKFGLGYSKKFDKILSPTILGGLHYVLGEVNKEKTEEFLSKLCSGDELSVGSPILALRNKLIKVKVDKTYHLTMTETIKNIVYAWEKYLKGENIKNIKLPENYEINLQTNLFSKK